MEEATNPCFPQVATHESYGCSFPTPHRRVRAVMVSSRIPRNDPRVRSHRCRRCGTGSLGRYLVKSWGSDGLVGPSNENRRDRERDFVRRPGAWPRLAVFVLDDGRGQVQVRCPEKHCRRDEPVPLETYTLAVRTASTTGPIYV